MTTPSSNVPQPAASANPLPLVVLADANVFFGPRLRDIFMHLHEQEVVHLAWTLAIENEWVRNVTQKQKADIQKIVRCVEGMRRAVEDWEITNYAQHEERFSVVDEKDRHVAAAAYQLSVAYWPGEKVALVTNNVRHFPATAFAGTNVLCYSADQYLTELYRAVPEQVMAVLESSRLKLTVPPLDQTKYVAVLVKNGCQNLARAIAAEWCVPCPSLTKDGKVIYDPPAETQSA